MWSSSITFTVDIFNDFVDLITLLISLSVLRRGCGRGESCGTREAAQLSTRSRDGLFSNISAVSYVGKRKCGWRILALTVIDENVEVIDITAFKPVCCPDGLTVDVIVLNNQPLTFDHRKGGLTSLKSRSQPHFDEE